MCGLCSIFCFLFFVFCSYFLYKSVDSASHISTSSWQAFQLLPFSCIFSFCRLSLFFILPLSSCQIDWHKGKDVTVKTIKKKQKHKGRGTVRTVTKQVPNDSFFNFFNPVKGKSTQTHIMFGISQELSKILLSLQKQNKTQVENFVQICQTSTQKFAYVARNGYT